MRKITNPWGNCNPIIEYEVMASFLNNGGTPEQCGHIVAAMMDYWEKGCPEDYDNELDLMEWSIFEQLKPKLRHGLQQYINGTKPKPNPNTTQTEPKGNPIEYEYEYRIGNREFIEEKDDDENNAHAREEFSSSSSSLKDFYSLCKEMKSGSKFSEEVRMLNPLYNVSDDKYDDWVTKFMQYKKLVADDGFKSRSDVRKNFINWLPSQLKKEQELSAAKEYTLTPEEQKMAVDSIKSRVTYLTDQQILEPLTAYCKKTGKNPTDVINDCIKSLDKEHIWGDVRSALLNFTNIPTMKAF